MVEWHKLHRGGGSYTDERNKVEVNTIYRSRTCAAGPRAAAVLFWLPWIQLGLVVRDPNKLPGCNEGQELRNKRYLEPRVQMVKKGAWMDVKIRTLYIV